MELDDPSSRRRPGRPPKYDWGDKRDICYKLFVEEQKSASEIVKYFIEHFNAGPEEIPHRKSFLYQFRLWGFPPHAKKLDSDEEALVQARIKELWEQNVNQKDIKGTLEEEGWELKDYEFSKLWKKNGLRLRNDTGFKPPNEQKKKKRKRSYAAAQEIGGSATPDGIPQAGMLIIDDPHHEDDEEGPIAAPMAPEEATLRTQRLLDIQVDSDQRLQARKRRRRIRGYGHLPPDAPGTAPRYNSETSLDECKAYLHLSNEMYQTVRKDYETICRDLGIVKKTQCADGVWEGSKQKLVLENMHLSAMMHPLQPDQEKKAVALDCLCSDVTKRMRVAGKSITVAEANNLLGLDPSESKVVRRSMYEILAADNFESRLVCGEEHWRKLRQRWYDVNEIVQQAVTENDPKKMKAVDLLCSDAMKRFREDKNKRGERLVVQRNAKYGPGPGPAWAVTAPRSKKGTEEKVSRDFDATMGIDIREPHVRAAVENRGYPRQESGNLISSLAQATGDIDFELDPALAAVSEPFIAPLEPSEPLQPIAAYFRLAPNSQLVGNHPKLWLGKLISPSIPALHSAATCKTAGAVVVKVHGVVKNVNGGEDSWMIDSEEELTVYLEEAGEKAVFSVVLSEGYA